MELIDARDVLDANAKVTSAFAGRIRGYFQRTGPNRWDDYRYVRRDGGTIEVLPGLRVQLERRGARIRMRYRGRVIRVEWESSPRDAGAAQRGRQAFVARHLERYDETSGLGAAAVIARKLSE